MTTATAQKLKPTIPLSSIRTFPPPQALALKDSESPVLFSSDTWATSQPQPPAALTTFAHQVGLGKLSTNPTLIQQACTREPITLPYSSLGRLSTSPALTQQACTRESITLSYSKLDLNNIAHSNSPLFFLPLPSKRPHSQQSCCWLCFWEAQCHFASRSGAGARPPFACLGNSSSDCPTLYLGCPSKTPKDLKRARVPVRTWYFSNLCFAQFAL